MKHKTLFTFICYKEEDYFYRNIKKLEKAGHDYFIFYNSIPKDKNIKDLKNKYFISKQNIGISRAMNYLFKHAKSNNFDFMLFLDQDTDFSEDSFSQLFAAESFLQSNKNTSAIQLVNRNGQKEVFYKKRYFIINSCTLFMINRTYDIGLYDEKYFVELADYSYCVNSSILGFEVGTFASVTGIDHFINQPEFKKKFFLFKLKIRVYPEERVAEMKESFKRLFLLCVKKRRLYYAFALLKFFILWSIKLSISKILN